MRERSNTPQAIANGRLRVVARIGRHRLKRPWTLFHFWVERVLGAPVMALAMRRIHYSDACARTRWLGTRTHKIPLDLWIYQEIIEETRPDLIVETGTAYGGSAAFMAAICELVGNGEVVSIDINPVSPDYPEHPRLTYLGGRSSVSEDVLADVRRLAEGKRTMVVLDSDHSQAHVAAELEAYGPLVSQGCYLIVEDTSIGLVSRDLLPGPTQAVRQFMSATDDFEIDASRERFMITNNPGGYLRRRESTG
jgi:cephalosporin hydroxylase